MNQKLKIFSSLGIVAAALSLILLAGCSDNLSVNPDPVQSPSINAGARLSAPTPTIQEAEEEPIVTDDSKLISEVDGGEIIITRDKYRHVFRVESEAVDEKVTITVSSYEDKVWGKRAIVFDFGPDGLKFDPAARLEIDMRELNSKAEYAKLYYYNPDYKIWILQSVKEVNGKRAEFEIHHFSKYAISD